MSDDELVADTTEGYTVSTKLSVNEYVSLDAEDDSLVKWKQSLGLACGTPLEVAAGDNRKVVILSLGLEIQGHDPIVVDTTQAGALDELRRTPIVLKEGSLYRVKIRFRVQHEIITGLRYLQLVKRKGLRVDKSDEVCGSYSPNTVDRPEYEKTFLEEEAPSGMLARGTYDVVSKFVDDDDSTHLQFQWTLQIKKTWD
ncbi:immunoglobulin E-set [Dipodascopsis tothii]|uniref:immunoglobulin E-set n=1 Tax=Dipodascopsis tothii TaxID=44089 RepID=UPI0034CDCDB5